MKKQIVRLLLMVFVSALDIHAARPPDEAVLLRGYYRYFVSQQVGGQLQTMSAQLPAPTATEVRSALTTWSGQRIDVVRRELTAQFGDQGRPRFEQFFAAYTAAENKNDPQFLHKVCDALGLSNPYPADYGALRQMALTAWLQPDIQTGSKFLSDVQMWLQLKNRTPNIPPLAAWLTRDAPVAKPVPPPPPKTVAQQLAGAEAPLPEFKADDDMTNSSPLDAFLTQRKERRERSVKEAQEGMAQVASERQGAEQELASKKQAEAEAIKNHAQKLAAAEQAAIEQEKDSWSSKLKGIVGATISAAGGAFFGGVGAQAGQMAADMIFQKPATSAEPTY